MNSALKFKKINDASRSGFTLIELLVVIAVLGILAAVVLVAINPGERLNEAKDSNSKNSVGQAATALESCYTNSQGDYSKCNSSTLLAPSGGAGYLKLWPNDGFGTALSVSAVAGAAGPVAIYGAMSATANKPTGCTSAFNWCYSSNDGQARGKCGTPANGLCT